MKLTKLQSHYNKFFKSNREIFNRIPQNKSYTCNTTYYPCSSERYYPFKRIPHVLMNSINLNIHWVFELSTANINANHIIGHGCTLKRIINNKTVFFNYDGEFNKFDAYTLVNEREYIYDLIMFGKDYHMEIENTQEHILQHIDFSTEFTEELIFQQSLVHNYDLVLWKEAFNILTVLNNIHEPTISKIYKAFM